MTLLIELDPSWQPARRSRRAAPAARESIALETLPSVAARAVGVIMRQPTSEAWLLRTIAPDDAAELATLYASLDSLCGRGALRFVCASRGTALATLAGQLPPLSAFRRDAAPSLVRLSPHARIRFAAPRLIVESPTVSARLELHDGRAALALCRIVGIFDEGAGMRRRSSSIERELAMLLLHAGLAGSGAAPTSSDAASTNWEYADLLFHTRSRLGWWNDPIGVKPGRSKPDRPPAVAPMKAGTFALPGVDLSRAAAADPPLGAIMARRRSLRPRRHARLTLDQLSEFLARAARVQAVVGRRGRNAWTLRPSPSGGGCHPLDIYVVVHRCVGLSEGLYHYHPVHHRLEVVVTDPRRLSELFAGSDKPAPPDVLFVITARFGRTSSRYARIAYSMILKDVGALFQTMYLAATAMNLAPCAIGCGNSAAFAELTKTDPLVESSVGEFELSGTPASSSGAPSRGGRSHR